MRNQELVARPEGIRHHNRFVDEEFWAGEFAGKELMDELREAVKRTEILLEDLKKCLDD